MELIRALGELAEAPGPEQVRTARMLGMPGEPTRAEYTDLFVVQLYPYASVYLSVSGQLGGVVQEHIAGFWRVLKQPVPRDPDHIATLFSTYAQLAHRSTGAEEAYLAGLAPQLRHAFLWEHIASWILPFTARVRELGSTAYRAWATLIIDALEAEAAQVGPPSVLPLHLRNAPPLPSTADLEQLVSIVFSPLASGLIIARADISRCARDLGLGTRVAERRYTLQTLLTQDRVRVGGWLAAEARRQAEHMRSAPEAFRAIASHWEGRALATADLITHATIEDALRGVQERLSARD